MKTTRQSLPSPLAQTDQQIDRALSVLRETALPTGMEARIRARLAIAGDRSLQRNPWRTPTARNLFAAATTLLITLSIAAHLHHAPIASQPFVEHAANDVPPLRNSLSSVTSRAVRITTPGRLQQTPAAEERADQISQLPHDANDPDAIALAETLAPSQPAPPMPLTAEERQLARATRQGSPIELAELDLAREPALRARSRTRERSQIQTYVRDLLAPLVASEHIEPTPPLPAPDDSGPIPSSPR